MLESDSSVLGQETKDDVKGRLRGLMAPCLPEEAGGASARSPRYSTVEAAKRGVHHESAEIPPEEEDPGYTNEHDEAAARIQGMYRMKNAQAEVDAKRQAVGEAAQAAQLELEEAPATIVDPRVSQLTAPERAQEGHPYPLIPKPGEGAMPRLQQVPYQGAVGGNVYGTHPIDNLALSQATSVASRATSAPGALAAPPGMIPLVPQFTDASYWRIAT